MAAEQDLMVLHFQEITSLQDAQAARTFLALHDWNLAQAVQAFVRSDFSAAPSPSTRFQSSTALPGGGSERRGGGGGSDGSSWPVRMFGSLLQLAMSPFGTPVQPIVGAEAARRFVEGFEREFGTTRPAFVLESYQQAAKTAARECKFLVVYLHSKLHQDTPRFCRDTLTSETCVSFLNENFVVWGGSVDHAEPFVVSQSFQASGFPFLAVLLCGLPEGDHCLDRVDGDLEGDALVDRLTMTMHRHQPTLQRIERERQERTASAHLRQEQDLEFERALQADRQREADARAEQERKDQEEDAARSKAELDAALQLSQKLDREATVKRKRDRLGAEPPAGPETTKLRLQLPNGSKIDRRFLATAPLEAVRDFVDVYLGENELTLERYSFATNFPRRVFDDVTITLQQAGLHPQSVLYVQDLNA